MLNYPEIPGCKISKLLGEGGVSSVYLGVQEQLSRNVAVKVLNPALLANKELTTRFDREAKTAASLSHSNIVQIFDTGKAGHYHYIVMEYLNDSLRDRLRRNRGRLPPPISLDIVEKILNALDYAHSHGIFHRDIKPGNIMFREDSTPVLVDFGLARVVHAADELTKAGTSMGTSSYMSPELCLAEKIDGRSDIYALGVVLFEMLSGAKPYQGDDHIEIAVQHIKKPVPKLPPDIERYQPLIDRMMAKDRAKRLSSAAEFEDLFFEILSETPEPDSRPGEPSSPPTIESPAPVESSSPPQKPETPSLPGKPGTPALNKIKPGTAAAQKPGIYSTPSRDKPISFADVLKEKITTLFANYMNLLKTGLKSFKTDPVEKKAKTAALGASPVIILLLLIVLIVSFGKGNRSGGKKETRTAALTAEQIKEQEYNDKYNLVSRYIEKHDFQAAGPIAAELKKIKVTQELRDLEKKMNRFKGKLRSEYESTFSYGDIKEMIATYNFFENSINNGGAFSGRCTNRVKNDDPVVICYTTGLVWYDGQIPGSSNFQEAGKWLDNLNLTGYGGYFDWRFPTLAEAASLLRKRMSNKGFHSDAVFYGNPRTIWTNDRFSEGEYWVVDLEAGAIKLSTGSGKHQVRPVRHNRD